MNEWNVWEWSGNCRTFTSNFRPRSTCPRYEGIEPPLTLLIIHHFGMLWGKSGHFANCPRFAKNPAASLTMKKPLISQGSGFVILWFWTRQRTGCPDFRHTMWNPFEKFHTLRRSNQSRRSVLISWWVCPIRMNSMWCHRVGWSWQCGCRVIWHLCNPLNQPRLRC